MIKGLHVKEPGENQLTHFGWGAALLALALACWFYYKTGELTANSVIIWGSVSFSFATLTLLSRVGLRAVFIAWMTFGAALGWVNLRILMALTLYLVFAPIRLIQKLIGRDILERKLERGPKRKTYFSEKKPLAPDHFRRMF